RSPAAQLCAEPRRASATGATLVSSEILCPVTIPRSLGREPRSTASGSDEPSDTSESRDDVNAAACAIRSEDDLAAVCRKARHRIVGWIVGQSEWDSSVDLLDPDIEIVLTGAIRCKREEPSIGRELRHSRDTCIVGESLEFP